MINNQRKVFTSLKNKKSYASSMSGEEMVKLCKEHTMFSWSAQSKVAPIPMVKAEGVHFWDASGILERTFIFPLFLYSLIFKETNGLT